MHIERAAEMRCGKAKTFWPRPEYAALDRNGYALQVNFLLWKINLARIGSRNIEHPVKDIVIKVFPPFKK